MYRSKKNTIIKRSSAAALVAAGVIAGGVSIASATTTHAPTSFVAHSSAPPLGPRRGDGPGGPPSAGGLVTSLSADSLTVSTPTGSVTYTISSGTTVTLEGSTSTTSSLAIGDLVRIQTSSSDATRAQSIEIDLPSVGGTVVSVVGDTITVTDSQGFYRTIDVSSATTYTKGSASSSLASISAGTFISAEGSVASDHTTLLATSVHVGAPILPSGGPVGGGPMTPGS